MTTLQTGSKWSSQRNVLHKQVNLFIITCTLDLFLLLHIMIYLFNIGYIIDEKLSQ